MPFLADLHTHSKYARACSDRLVLPNMAAWCQIKGVDLLSCADFTHPEWFAHLKQVLEEVNTGIYQVKEEHRGEAEIEVPEKCRRDMRFVLGTEVSLIYKRADKLRRVHLLVFAPNLAIAEQINRELSKRGNLASDGRPILGLDSEELLKILMNISPLIEVIPAHVWTPHFAVFGSKSGFDSIEACFGDMSEHIHALETGLSSDPPMNWRLSQNDRYVLVSNSDAHSPQKFGREATLFDTPMTYPGLLEALRSDHSKVLGTIEFFPEEGKYHCDGLRAEKLCLNPQETIDLDYVSPETGKPITVGVLHRIEKLADRPMGEKPAGSRPCWHIIPLPEILSELLGVGVASKRVQSRYFELIKQLGPEFGVLKDLPLAEISAADELLGEAIKRMRAGEVQISPGYDGEYGVVRLFKEGELEKMGAGSLQKGQLAMF